MNQILGITINKIEYICKHFSQVALRGLTINKIKELKNEKRKKNKIQCNHLNDINLNSLQ